MDPLTFAIQNEGTSCPGIQLIPCSPDAVLESIGKELATHFASIPKLIPYLAAILFRRYLEGYSAAAMHKYLIERWLKNETLGISGMLGRISPNYKGWLHEPVCLYR